MKPTVLTLLATFFSVPVFANAITLKCEFLPRTHLQGFTVVLSEESARLAFEGTADEDEDLNPSGENVVLKRENTSSDWLNYRGMEVVRSNQPCSYFLNNQCAAPARGFELSFSKAEISADKTVSGSLHMTLLSGYLPGEAYYVHGVTCTRQ